METDTNSSDTFKHHDNASDLFTLHRAVYELDHDNECHSTLTKCPDLCHHDEVKLIRISKHASTPRHHNQLNVLSGESTVFNLDALIYAYGTPTTQVHSTVDAQQRRLFKILNFLNLSPKRTGHLIDQADESDRGDSAGLKTMIPLCCSRT